MRNIFPECGVKTTVERACRACATEVSPEAGFCMKCGAMLYQGRPFPLT